MASDGIQDAVQNLCRLINDDQLARTQLECRLAEIEKQNELLVRELEEMRELEQEFRRRMAERGCRGDLDAEGRNLCDEIRSLFDSYMRKNDISFAQAPVVMAQLLAFVATDPDNIYHLVAFSRYSYVVSNAELSDVRDALQIANVS